MDRVMRTCDICGEGTVQIVLDDNLFLYQCTGDGEACHSEYADGTLNTCNYLMAHKYPTFNDWFDELEGFGMRSERFLAELPEDKRLRDMMIMWLQAAFECGRKVRNKE